jgi:hypothetical protein
MQSTTEFSLPANDLGPLTAPFNQLGKQAFGAEWPVNMAMKVRLGKRSGDLGERAKGQWALKALHQCVENGWLPLVYFVDGRRVRYFEAADGPTLHALYPQPTDDLDGQIELAGGDIYPCMDSILPRVRYGFVDQQIHFRGRQIFELRPCLRQRQIQQAPFDGVLDEPWQVAFLHSAPGKIGADLDIRF